MTETSIGQVQKWKQCL